MRYLFFLLLLLLPIAAIAQHISLRFQPVLQGKYIVLGEPVPTRTSDTITVHTLRFYLSNIVFLNNGAPVFSEKNSHHLLDLETESAPGVRVDLPAGTVSFTEIQFDLGIDSLANTAGAMGGDLDPTNGMYWAWQSGYINVKIEGVSPRCPARNHEFQFHLGGYLPPFQSVQTVRLPVPKTQNLLVDFDLTTFFEQVDWAKKSGIMSPGAEAKRLSEVLSKAFSVHVE
jgi:hypothetical protein